MRYPPSRVSLRRRKTRGYVHRPGGVSDTLNGAWDMNEDQFTVEPIPTSYYLIWAMSLNGNTLTLTGAGMTYDFDGVGGPDPADHNMTLVR